MHTLVSQQSVTLHSEKNNNWSKWKVPNRWVSKLAKCTIMYPMCVSIHIMGVSVCMIYLYDLISLILQQNFINSSNLPTAPAFFKQSLIVIYSLILCTLYFFMPISTLINTVMYVVLKYLSCIWTFLPSVGSIRFAW